MDLICKCGHEMFNVATNGKYARCSKCGTVYDEIGEEVQVHKSFEGCGEVLFIKDNRILPPKISEYKPGQSLLDDDKDIEEY